MDDREERVRRLFDGAFELPANLRSSWLDRECAGDQALRLRLAAMLAAADDPGFLANSTRSSEVRPATTPLQETEGSRIGPYKLLQKIGEGGFGVVFLAEQERPVRRRVAVKVIKLGMDTRQVVARFEAERQALAMMDHPNIAKVLDAGATESGRPYFVMEMVKGVPITEYCDKNHLTGKERLELLIRVCHAVQHAHHKGVIHRDIKPSNILVTLHDGVPVPKVIDFGLAKATDHRLTEKTLFTEHRAFVGTPMYMSPEQAELSGLDVDTRTDVYSLGVLLYELLTGTTPFPLRDLLAGGYLELQRIIREVDPPKPSTRVSTMGELVAGLASQRRIEPRKFSAFLRGDLDWIVMRCLEKDRTRRYATATALGEDLQRHLAGEAVEAAPPSMGYRTRKFVRRQRGPLIAVALILLTAVLGAIVSVFYSIDAGIQASVAEKEAAVAKEERLRADRNAEEVKQINRAQRAQLTEASWAAFNQANRLFAAADQTSNAALRGTNAREGLLHLARSLSLDPANGVAWERFAFEAVRRTELWGGPRPVMTFVHDAYIRSVAFSDDGSRVLTTSDDDTARVWDAVSGAMLHNLEHPDDVRLASYRHDGRQLITVCAVTARLWDATSGRLVHALEHKDAINFAAFSCDGTRVLTASDDHTAKVWDTDSGKELLSFAHKNRVYSAFFSSDRARVLTIDASNLGTKRTSDVGAHLWDAVSSRLVGSFECKLPNYRGAYYGASLSPDGARVLTSCYDNSAKLWDATSGKLVHTFEHAEEVSSVAFGPDGTRVLTASEDGRAKIWDAASGRLLRTLIHEYGVKSALFSSDGQRVLTMSADGTKVWDTASGQLLALEHSGWVNCASLNREGSRVLTNCGNDSSATLWDTSRGVFAQALDHEEPASIACLSPNGSIVVSAGQKGAKIWDRDSGKVMLSLKDAHIRSASFSPDNLRVVTTNAQVGRATIWDAKSGTLLHTLQHSAPNHACFSPDGLRVLTAGEDKSAKLWDTSSGTLLHILVHAEPVHAACFSLDGNKVITTSVAKNVTVFDEDTGTATLTYMSGACRACFSHDGRYALTAGTAATVWDCNTGEALLRHRLSSNDAEVWEVASGKTVAKLSSYYLSSASFGAGGSLAVVTDSYSQETDVWDVLSAKRLRTLEHYGSHSAYFSPDGSHVLTWGDGDEAKIWDTASGKLVQTVEHDGSVQSASFSADGTRVVTASSDKTVKIADISAGLGLRSAATADDVPSAMAIAELLTRKSLSPEGDLEDLTYQRLEHDREVLQRLLTAVGPLTPLARFLAAHGPQSPAYFGAAVTCSQRADILVAHGGARSAREALQLDPTHPLVRIALAAHESVEPTASESDKAAAGVRRAFLRDYDLRRLPADASICARAATMLLAQGDKVRALEAADKALAVDPANAIAQLVKKEAVR
ncbi:MAG: protein kinase [Planctomycetes bacterium]|nr:protein kinase [Planctomycetota bacterium]